MPRRRYTEEQFRAAVADPRVESLADLCRAVGILPAGGNYASLRNYARTLRLSLDHLAPATPKPRRGLRPGERSYSDDDLRRALEEEAVVDRRTLCEHLALCPHPLTYARLRAHAEQLGLHIPFPWDARADSRTAASWSDDDVRDAVLRSSSFAAALRLLGSKPGGSAYRRLHAAIDRLDLVTTHMKGQAWATGRTLPPRRPPIEEVLVAGRSVHSSQLRNRLIAEGVKRAACEGCGLARWRDGPIPLELDHRNGDRLDNRLGNLRLLCPNCHALTPTYRGRNIGRASG